jgi:LuxR family maltose regulon positive regulatory protein
VESPLIATKLHRPRASAALVPLPRLSRELTAGLGQQLTLISAPAGYGKTTAVNLWLESIAQPYAWLSLDEQDSNLALFAAYLVAALRTAYPEAGRNLSVGLAGPQDAQAEVLAALFVKDLEALGKPLVLVLDDYHLVREKEIQVFMARVIQTVPDGIHWVLISRADPPIGLARLRGRGQLAELRSPDLRFTRDETAELVQRLLGETAANDLVDCLHERTEGWPVGLQLAGIAARESENRLEFARRFAQTGHRPVIDYPLNEVLAELGEEQYVLALRASMLTRFCAQLCDVLTEGTQAQGQSQKLIDQAWKSNLFLISLDAEGIWYRYHHLFRDLLRQRLIQTVAPDTLIDLHQRVSLWFEKDGHVEEAVIHAVHANDVVRAAQLVESNIDNALNREDWRLIERWLALLPKAALQRPGLLVAQAYVQHFRFNLGGIDGLLDASVAGFAANTFSYSEEQIAQLDGHIHQLHSHGLSGRSAEQRLYHATAALQILAPEARFARSQAELFYGMALHHTGRTEEALAFLSDGLRQQIAQPDARATRLVIGSLSIHYARADLASTATTAKTLLSITQTQDRPLSSGWAHFALGWVHYQRDDLGPAMQHFLRGIDVRYVINARAAIDCYIGLALAQQANGHPEAASQTATDLREFLVGLDLFSLAMIADALDLRLALNRECQAGSRRHWQTPAELTAQPETQLAADTMMIPALTAIQAAVTNSTDDSLAAAWSLPQRCRTYAESVNSRRHLIEIGALETLLHAAQGEDKAALSALQASVLLAEPGGALRLIADSGPGLVPYLQQLRDLGVAATYITRVLTVYEHGGATRAMHKLPLVSPYSASPDIMEDLTLREVEVLRLLAQGLSNKEIAQELTVSPNTVKKHTINLYQKLHVPNRRRAIRIAQALGYLPQDR